MQEHRSMSAANKVLCLLVGKIPHPQEQATCTRWSSMQADTNPYIHLDQHTFSTLARSTPNPPSYIERHAWLPDCLIIIMPSWCITCFALIQLSCKYLDRWKSQCINLGLVLADLVQRVEAALTTMGGNTTQLQQP